MKFALIAVFALVAMISSFTFAGSAHAAGGQSDAMICWEVEGVEGVDIECDFVDDLQAECKTYDPKNKSDVCKKVNSAQIVLPIVRFSNNGMGLANANSTRTHATFVGDREDHGDRGGDKGGKSR